MSHSRVDIHSHVSFVFYIFSEASLYANRFAHVTLELSPSCISEDIHICLVAALLPFAGEQLPVQLCQGYTLQVERPAQEQHATVGPRGRHTTVSCDGGGAVATMPTPAQTQKAVAGAAPYPVGSPSLLGPVYIAAHGPDKVIVGATKRYAISAVQALAACARGAAALGPASAKRYPRAPCGFIPADSLGAGPATEVPGMHVTHAGGDVHANGLHAAQRRVNGVHESGSRVIGVHANGCTEAETGRERGVGDGSDDEAVEPLSGGCSATEVAEAMDMLLPIAESWWPPLSQWEVTGVRSGVRALASYHTDGNMPFAGRLIGSSCPGNDDMMESGSNEGGGGGRGVGGGAQGGNWWMIAGLGARGLVYHAWLGELIAKAVVEDSEEGLPTELLRWRPEWQRGKYDCSS